MTEMTAAAPPARRRVSRWSAIFVALAVAAAVVVVFWLVGSSGPSQGGPLVNSEVTAAGQRQHPGDTIGYGVPMAWNSGEEPVMLKSARLINPTAGMEVVETYVSPPDRKKNGIALSETWPSDEYSDLRPVSGMTLAPRSTPQGDRGAQFVFALRFPKLGDYQHDGVEVAYTADGKDYVMQIQTSMRICVVPKSEALQGPCDTPDAFKNAGN